MLALLDLLDSLTNQSGSADHDARKPDYDESEPADHDLAFAEIGEQLLSLTP